MDGTKDNDGGGETSAAALATGRTGTRRRLLIGAVVILLVAAVAGGTITAAMMAGADARDDPASSPTATSSAGATPTPIAASIAPVPVALGGDCSRLLSDGEATGIFGTAVERTPALWISDPAVIGGVSCFWTTPEQSGTGLRAAVYPIAVVPPSVSAQDAGSADCSSGLDCVVSASFGDAWVVVSAPSPDQAALLLQTVGERAAAEPGVAATLPAGSWSPPACDALRATMSAELGRDDLIPYAGDAYPSGREWDLQRENGIASWCAALGEGDDVFGEMIEVYVAPGSSGLSPEAVAAQGMTAVDVPRAASAWITQADPARRSTTIAASTGGNALLVTARFIDREALAVFVGDLIVSLEATAR